MADRVDRRRLLALAQVGVIVTAGALAALAIRNPFADRLPRGGGRRWRALRGGPRLGDIESGLVASVTTASISVISGGLMCLVGVGAIVLAFPALAAFHGAQDAVEPTPAPAPA